MIKTVDNSKANRELVRIQWREWVMSQPGGIDWLASLVRVAPGKGMREQDMGSHNLTWPPNK